MDAAQKKASPALEGTEWVAWRIETVAHLERAMVEKFTEALAYDIIYNVGYTMGRKAYPRYVEEAQSDEPNILLAVYVRRKRQANWGRCSFENVNLREMRVVVRVYDCFERKAGVFKNCPFSKGYICGFLSEMFKTSVTATEKHTAEFCEFHMEGKRNK